MRNSTKRELLWENNPLTCGWLDYYELQLHNMQVHYLRGIATIEDVICM